MLRSSGPGSSAPGPQDHPAGVRRAHGPFGAGLAAPGAGRAIHIVVATAVAILLSSVSAAAQGRPLRARGDQALSFGELLGGIPTTILPSDPLNSGQIDIRGEKRADVLVEFLLPGAMAGPAGASIPLSFGLGMAGYSVFNSIASQAPFDPSLPQVVQLDKTGRGMIYLGGTATPPHAAAVGAYTATISLTISYLGN